MPKLANQFLDVLTQVQSNPTALMALVALGAFMLVGGALYVVYTALKKCK